MSKHLRTAILLLVCLLFTVPAYAQFADFVVDDDGNPLNTYPTLTQAVATAELYAGSDPIRIIIEAGSYSDVGVVIDHGAIGVITAILGAGSDSVFFTAPQNDTGVFLDPSGTTDLEIAGINVANYLYGMGTMTAGCTGLNIHDCIFDNNGEDSLPGNAGAAIFLSGDNMVVDGCEIMNGERGILLYAPANNADNNSILNNSIHDNEQYGIGMFGAAGFTMNGATVTGNVLENCADAGIQLWANGAAAFNGPTVDGNTVTASTWEGIIVAGAAGGSVSGNTVTGCSKATVGGGGNSNPSPYGGISIASSSGVTVHSNTSHAHGDAAIAGSEYGIRVTGSGNSVRYNCLFNHAGVQGDDAGDGSNVWRFNYFDDLSGNASFPDYLLDGSAGEIDTKPSLYDNSAVLAGGASSPMEVWSTLMSTLIGLSRRVRLMTQ